MKALSRAGVILLGLLALTAFYNYFPSDPLDTNKKIDKIIVHKSKRTMEVCSENEVLKIYKIALGFSPEGHKEHEGDGRTPEGTYRIDRKNPASRYHLSLGISYPEKDDKEVAKRAGRPAGGDIMIHGLKYGAIGKLHRLWDWTQGCIAVTNSEIEEIYNNVETGTAIEILP